MIRYWFAGSLFVLMLVALFWGGSQPVAVGLVSPPWDKLLHGVFYFCMAFLLGFGLRLPLWVVLVVPLLVGAADEFHQMGLPGRFPSYSDWLADFVGVFVCWVLMSWESVVGSR